LSVSVLFSIIVTVPLCHNFVRWLYSVIVYSFNDMIISVMLLE